MKCAIETIKIKLIQSLLTSGVLQLYRAMRAFRAWPRSSTLFWSFAICTIFCTALLVDACFGKSSLRQYVVARFVTNFTSAIFVLTVGVCAGSTNILESNQMMLFSQFIYIQAYEDKSTYLKTAVSCNSDGNDSCTKVSVFQILLCIDPSSSAPNLLNKRVKRTNNQSCKLSAWNIINSFTESRNSA